MTAGTDAEWRAVLIRIVLMGRIGGCRNEGLYPVCMHKVLPVPARQACKQQEIKAEQVAEKLHRKQR
jgi:hypothetical protein